MHLSPPESPVTEANHLAAESDADTLELQSNDVGLASCWQRAARLSQATTVSVSSQRRSPSPFSKLKEMVLSFEDDSDDETDPVDFRRKTLSSALPQSSFKVPLVKKSTSVRKSVKSKGQGGRRSLDERNGPGKSQPARRKGCSRGSPSLLVKQRVVSDKEQVSMSDSDCADAATSDVASASFNADGTRLMNVSAAKTEDLSPSKKKASTRRDSPRTSLPTNKTSKLPEANETSESERNGASRLDSDEFQRDENEPLEAEKDTRKSPKMEKMMAGRKEVQATSTGCDVSHSSKQQLEESITARVAGSCRSPSRTPPKRRGVGEASANVTPGPETAEHDLSETNDNLGGLTQVPLLRNVDALPNSLSSDKEGGPCSSRYAANAIIAKSAFAKVFPT
ncbi:hypothetical protein MRX96_046075 [Rhipicephalus microplus]